MTKALLTIREQRELRTIGRAAGLHPAQREIEIDRPR